MSKRVAAKWGVAVGACAALLAHLAYWYLPRERSDGPPSPAAAELLADPQARTALWIAYPHQNLARLERFVGDVPAWLSLVLDRDPADPATLPRVGPFVVPPATELAFVPPESGGASRAIVRAYPSMAAIAKLAGRLASNPWLGGGETGRPGEEVSWEGRLWRLGPPSPPLGVVPAGIPAGEVAPLAILATRERLGPLPAATYRLLRGAEGIELRSGAARQERPMLVDGPDRPVALRLERGPRGQLAILVIWPEEGLVPPFPAAATLTRRGARRPTIPGEELMRLAGRKPIRVREGGAELSALSERELERLRRLAPMIDRLLVAAESARMIAVVDPAAATEVARRLSDRFADTPFAALAGIDPRRWLELLAPWEGCGEMALVVGGPGEGTRAWLCPPAIPR